jgi:hypothetical protein
LKISIAGRLIPQSKIVELKSYSARNSGNAMAGFARSSYFARVKTVCVEKTDPYGLTKIETMNVTDHVEQWAQRQQPKLLTLHALLQKMREHTSNSASGMCLLRPLLPANNVVKRSWELFEIEDNDPILQNIAEPTHQIMFSG